MGAAGRREWLLQERFDSRAAHQRYGNPLARDRSAEAIYVPLPQAGVPAADVVVRYRASEVAGRQALHQVLGAVDPLLVPGYVHRSAEGIRKAGLVAVGLTKLLGGCFRFALLLVVAGCAAQMRRQSQVLNCVLAFVSVRTRRFRSRTGGPGGPISNSLPRHPLAIRARWHAQCDRACNWAV